MTSTATRNMQSTTCRFLHRVLHFAVLTFVAFGTWIGARVLAAIKALTRLYAYIMPHFIEPPFRFLDLPPEVRNLVYHHHFTLYRTPEYQKKLREMTMLPDAILNVNRQVYEEASHALYSRFFFLITVTGTKIAHGHESYFAGLVPKISHVLRHMATIHLKIRWPGSDWHGSPERDETHDPSFVDLKASVKMVCTSLAQLPNLRTIKIHFAVEESSHSSRTLSPAKYRIPSLLRPLKLLRRANPEIVVELPDYCPISTAELAEQQKDCPFGFDRRKEWVEDLKEELGDLQAMWEEYRRTDE